MKSVFEVTCREVPAYRRFFTTRERASEHVDFVARNLGFGKYVFEIAQHTVDD